MVANIAVNGVGKVHHRSPFGQGHDAAFGCEHINRIGKQIDLHVVPKFGSVPGFFLNVQQRLQPLGAQALRCFAVVLIGFVKPVSRHTRFGHQVHVFGANLKLHINARRTDQRGV